MNNIVWYSIDSGNCAVYCHVGEDIRKAKYSSDFCDFCRHIFSLHLRSGIVYAVHNAEPCLHGEQFSYFIKRQIHGAE